MAHEHSLDHEVVGFDITGDEIHGLPGGFLGVRRLHLTNRRADGSHSKPWICDFVVRPKGIDAVVVAIWHRAGDGRVRLLLRACLRPALSVGRAETSLPIPDRRVYRRYDEVVAGIIEHGDTGEDGVRRRAALEVAEEAGLTVSPDAVQFLGAASFPTPGSMPEKFWLLSVEVDDPDAAGPLQGDGSPMEEGASTRWVELDVVIADCVAGRIEDMKTELVARRLRDALA